MYLSKQKLGAVLAAVMVFAGNPALAGTELATVSVK
jgi:hypothetical protein